MVLRKWYVGYDKLDRHDHRQWRPAWVYQRDGRVMPTKDVRELDIALDTGQVQNPLQVSMDKMRLVHKICTNVNIRLRKALFLFLEPCSECARTVGLRRLDT